MIFKQRRPFQTHVYVSNTSLSGYISPGRLVLKYQKKILLYYCTKSCSKLNLIKKQMIYIVRIY